MNCCCKSHDARACYVARHPESKARYDDECDLISVPWYADICECDCHNGGRDDIGDDEEECRHGWPKDVWCDKCELGIY